MSNSGHRLNPDQEFWGKICKPAISGLMDHSGTYTLDEKDSNLYFFAEHVTAWLGPQPSGHVTKDASPLDVSSPVEASLNFSSNGKPIVRFQFEPLSVTVPVYTDPDPFGQTRVRAMLSQMEKQATGVDLRWTNQFIQALFPTDPDEVVRVRALEKKLPFPLDHALTFNVAFDLDGARRKMKAYFFPMAKSFATGQTGESLAFETIRNLNPYGADLVPAVNFLERYFHSCPDSLTIDMVGLDCADPSVARIKVYAHLQTSNSWNAVRHVSTFGEQATDEIRLQGLEILHSIWHLLRGEKEALPTADDFNKPLRDPKSFLGSIMFSFEMVAGCAIPEIKTYVPLWQYGASDRKIAENLVAAFRSLGWHSAADNYLPNLRNCFPGAELDGPASLHSNVSFAYSKKTGAYMTVYYAVSGKSVAASKAEHVQG